MNCELDPIVCELSEIADAITVPDWTGFWLTLVATALGVVVPIGIAWWVLRGELRSRRQERREDAIVRVMDALAAYSADCWYHHVRLKEIGVAGVANGAANRGQFNPDPPALDRVEHAISAAKVILRSNEDRSHLESAWSRLSATTSVDGDWRQKSGQSAGVSKSLADAFESGGKARLEASE